MQTMDDALIMFRDGFNCSQVVFSRFAENLGLPKDKALMIASGFGAGMGRMARTCGAVTGAFMALGLRDGYSSSENRECKERIYSRIREFGDRFREIHGSIECCELLGFNISTPEGYKEAADSGIFRDRCPRFVQSAIEIAEEMLRL